MESAPKFWQSGIRGYCWLAVARGGHRRPGDSSPTIALDRSRRCRPADLPTCRPADLPTCRPADLPTCRPWSWMTTKVQVRALCSANSLGVTSTFNANVEGFASSCAARARQAFLSPSNPLGISSGVTARLHLPTASYPTGKSERSQKQVKTKADEFRWGCRLVNINRQNDKFLSKRCGKPFLENPFERSGISRADGALHCHRQGCRSAGVIRAIMSNVTIKSNNQSGGVTAQSVTTPTAQSTENKTKPEGRFTKLFWWIFGIAGVIGAAASVVAIFK